MTAGADPTRPPRVGWLSTGRDPAARALLTETLTRAHRDGLPLDVAVVACDRARGEQEESDRFLDLVGELGVPLETLSSSASWAQARASGTDRETWRATFHDHLMERLQPRRPDLLVLAGYMLILSPAMCSRYAALNLHPALPDGPTGSWQDVIWGLLREGASETGAMIHLVTPELDRGPVVTFDRFPIRGDRFDALWSDFDAKVVESGLDAVARDEGEREPLFAQIRHVGESREIPLLYRTIAQFVTGRLEAGHGHVGGEEELPLDLTDEVDREVGA